jgi:hypothetical protein
MNVDDVGLEFGKGFAHGRGWFCAEFEFVGEGFVPTFLRPASRSTVNDTDAVAAFFSFGCCEVKICFSAGQGTEPLVNEQDSHW